MRDEFRDPRFTMAMQRMLQQGENSQSFYDRRPDGSALKIDGDAGEYTLKGLQRWAGATPDGIVGPKTMAALAAKLHLPLGASDADIATALQAKLQDGHFYDSPESKPAAQATPATPSAPAAPPATPPAVPKPTARRRRDPALRAQPPVTTPSSIGSPTGDGTLIYYVPEGYLTDSSGRIIATADSGKWQWRNKKQFENLASKGPVPAQTYGLEYTSREKLGGPAIHLVPTNLATFPRTRDPNSFFIHRYVGNFPGHRGSLGCIALQTGETVAQIIKGGYNRLVVTNQHYKPTVSHIAKNRFVSPGPFGG
ncbi:MAG TPA: peptidoglycan-binding domain-containing protein [Alphaproteobacteria bacterium]|nr:peptidoglycan-binding domain-containing protein [Alphaproteobacteria bacterium]